MREIARRGIDEQLLAFIRNEVALFRMVERKLFGPQVTRAFRDIDEFVDTALRILNARKSRAGRALENHLEYLLREAGLRFEMRARVEGTSPDILLPGKREYNDALAGRYPVEKLIMVGLKTTCKDRWRQVLSEAPKIPTKHLLTLQEGISPRQLDEMHRSNIVLIVPADLQKAFPKGSPVKMLDLAAFVESARRIVG